MRREMKIEKDDAVFILGEAKALDKLMECPECGHQNNSKNNVTIFLNDIGDVSLHGQCEKCSSPFFDYLESGADYQAFRRANQVMMKGIR